MCQCPERGDLHFHVNYISTFDNRFLECQCPERGDLHFYFKRVDAGCTEKDCVNALKGATFISTVSIWSEGVCGILCQCPERGDLHFYGYIDDVLTRVDHIMCQCPERGDLHFYADPLYEIHTGSMCQCPERGDLHFYYSKQNEKKIEAEVSMP